MKQKKITGYLINFIGVLFLPVSLSVFAHPGRTDQYRCHTNHSTGEYHCHGNGTGTTSTTSTSPTTSTTTVTPTTTSTTGGNDFESGKQAGIQQCVSNPASCGLENIEMCQAGDGTGSTHATYNPTTGEVHIPLIDVLGAFGKVQTYEIYMIQQPLTFTFDMDLKRIIQH